MSPECTDLRQMENLERVYKEIKDQDPSTHRTYEVVAEYYLMNSQRATEIQRSLQKLYMNVHFPVVYTLLFTDWLFTNDFSRHIEPVRPANITTKSYNVWIKGANSLFKWDLQHGTFFFSGLFDFACNVCVCRNAASFEWSVLEDSNKPDAPSVLDSYMLDDMVHNIASLYLYYNDEASLKNYCVELSASLYVFDNRRAVSWLDDPETVETRKECNHLPKFINRKHFVDNLYTSRVRSTHCCGNTYLVGDEQPATPTTSAAPAPDITCNTDNCQYTRSESAGEHHQSLTPDSEPSHSPQRQVSETEYIRRLSSQMDGNDTSDAAYVTANEDKSETESETSARRTVSSSFDSLSHLVKEFDTGIEVMDFSNDTETSQRRTNSADTRRYQNFRSIDPTNRPNRVPRRAGTASESNANELADREAGPALFAGRYAADQDCFHNTTQTYSQQQALLQKTDGNQSYYVTQPCSDSDHAHAHAHTHIKKGAKESHSPPWQTLGGPAPAAHASTVGSFSNISSVLEGDDVDLPVTAESVQALYDMFVLELLKLTRRLHGLSEYDTVTSQQLLPCLAEVDLTLLSPRTIARLESMLYKANTYRQPNRQVRLAARRTMDKLFPRGMYARYVVSGAFKAILYPWNVPYSLYCMSCDKLSAAGQYFMSTEVAVSLQHAAALDRRENETRTDLIMDRVRNVVQSAYTKVQTLRHQSDADATTPAEHQTIPQRPLTYYEVVYSQLPDREDCEAYAKQRLETSLVRCVSTATNAASYLPWRYLSGSGMVEEFLHESTIGQYYEQVVAKNKRDVEEPVEIQTPGSCA
ncbi:hypothetical protein SARC_02194 [Sphaeroforma arctica JP610]|uniref:Uncharacterized protein n=1 Tax=Sphaeroforma arctica JP610 TaxID=667725 RepID=A0A0L0G9S5_9EUKA|nr:hypothetical protein SARC_02194 [Sphaeroforma arctica JP610]KNC85621.1 hypothetical protein SARC_02194 [Sphaeroforma arctica JP610]|eukprot:XP_014159523.1 hypothetical protein SARC_02194 [Sphaeroforma arctica JP610]